jgi:hypothetical protein
MRSALGAILTPDIIAVYCVETVVNRANAVTTLADLNAVITYETIVFSCT